MWSAGYSKVLCSLEGRDGGRMGGWVCRVAKQLSFKKPKLLLVMTQILLLKCMDTFFLILFCRVAQ